MHSLSNLFVSHLSTNSLISISDMCALLSSPSLTFVHSYLHLSHLSIYSCLSISHLCSHSYVSVSRICVLTPLSPSLTFVHSPSYFSLSHIPPNKSVQATTLLIFIYSIFGLYHSLDTDLSTEYCFWWFPLALSWELCTNSFNHARLLTFRIHSNSLFNVMFWRYSVWITGTNLKRIPIITHTRGDW